jgi:hypothetical protein
MLNPITHQPKIIVSHRCTGLISECGGGPSPVDGGGAWRRDDNGKIIDKWNHSTKALTYLIMQLFGFVENRRSPFGVIKVKR